MSNIIIKFHFVFLIIYSIPLSTGYAKERGMNVEKNQGYYFAMSQKDITKIIEKINSLKVGDDREHIVELLGSPTYDQIVAQKDGTFICRELTYYLKRWEENLVNKKYDSSIRLELDKENHLKRVIFDIPDP